REQIGREPRVVDEVAAGARPSVDVARNEDRARIALPGSGVDALDPLWILRKPPAVQLEELRQLRLAHRHSALPRSTNVTADVLPEPREHSIEIGELRKPPRVVRRLPKPVPAKGRPVVERGVAPCLEMRERTDPLEERLDERDLARAPPRTFPRCEQRPEERRQRCAGMDVAEPRRPHDGRPRRDNPPVLLELVRAPATRCNRIEPPRRAEDRTLRRRRHEAVVR